MNRPINSNPITIITPTKNRKKNLRDTILSVKKHKSNNVEYIIVDGNSTDGTIDLIKEFNGCIDHWISEKDSGLYEAMNKGWDIVDKDRFVLFLGAGDKLLSLPSEDLSILKDKVVYGRVKMGSNMLFVSKLSTITKFTNTIHHQSLLLPKKIHIDKPFDIRYKVYADFDLIQRLIKQKFTFLYSDSFLTYAMPGGLSENFSKEVYKIAYRNFGPIYGIASLLFYYYQKIKKNRCNSILFRRRC